MGVGPAPRLRRRALVSVLLVTLLAAGCATRPPASGESISGRMAVQVAATAKEVARQLSAGFELRGNGQAGELDLVSPLGTVVARARWEPGRVEVATSDGTRRFDSLSEMARRTLGEPIPLEALADWLRARPWPGSDHTAIEGGFEQGGWQVDLQRAAEGFIVAQRQSPAPTVTLRVRLDTPPAPRGRLP